MAERTEYDPGTPSWTDLTTPDLAASEQFYGTLFGWAFDEYDLRVPIADSVARRLRPADANQCCGDW